MIDLYLRYKMEGAETVGSYSRRKVLAENGRSSRRGVDADFVREQAGHKDLQTTLNFYAYSTTRNEKKLAQLNEALKMY